MDLRRQLSLSLVLVAALTATAVSPAFADPAGGRGASADAKPALSGTNPARAVVLLDGDPVATAIGEVSGARADAYRAQLAQGRAAFISWLSANAPQARVVWEYDTVLNGVSVELRGASAAALAGGPGVRQVLQPIWMSPTMNESLELIRWNEAFDATSATPGVTVGAGVKVGIVDSGIDQTHPFFDDSNAIYKNADGSCTAENDPSTTPFTNCKVIVAKVFNADTTLTPADIIGHGSHVAGTVAGNSGTEDASLGTFLSGVAPGAWLGNYNVFPGETGSASSDDIAAAVNEAVIDGMEVLNLSLGGPPTRQFDVLDLALKAAADVGVLAAVAAGNSGPGEGTIESPGWTPWVLTAGASTNPHFPGQTVTTDAGTVGGAVGDFDAFDPAVTADYVVWDDIDGRNSGVACERRPPSAGLTGQIALIRRGDCAFTVKVRAAESLGAIGVIISNNVAGDPSAMGHDGTEPFPAIPAVMVSKTYGAAVEALADPDQSVTVGGPVTDQAGTADIMAGFSSRGPATTPDGILIKPDMTAPGVNVNSSVPCITDDAGTTCGFAFFQGTSMATPHLAGAAAAVIWDRGLAGPDASGTRDEQVKSFLVNGAIGNVVTSHTDGETQALVMDQGAGRLDVLNAFNATFWSDPVSVSFGQVRGTTATKTTTFNADSDPHTATVTQTVEAPGLIVDAHVDRGTLFVTVTRTRQVRGDFEGFITVAAGEGATIRIPYWVRF